jgi:hypothetical protein
LSLIGRNARNPHLFGFQVLATQPREGDHGRTLFSADARISLSRLGSEVCARLSHEIADSIKIASGGVSFHGE